MPATAAARPVARLVLVAALALAGCAVPQDGARAPVERAAVPGDFALLSSAPRKAVIRVAGRRVAVTPAAGACLADDAIDISGGSAFLLLTDCLMIEADAGAGIDPVGDSLAKPFAGLVTVSLAGGPRGSLDRLQGFVQSPAGMRQLARGEEDGAIAVESAAQLGDALYVHAISNGEAAMPLLTRDFWRVFLELNGRMAVVTVSGFEGSGLTPENLFAEARRQARALIQGNPPDRDAAIIARLTDVSPARRQAGQGRAAETRPGLAATAAPAPEAAAEAADPGAALPEAGTVADLGGITLVVPPAGADTGDGLLPPRRPSAAREGLVSRPALAPDRPEPAGDAVLPPRRPRR